MVRFEYFDNCIICGSPLTAIRGQEHIIPRSIYGFWTCYDVCQLCLEYFGNNVDNLPLNSLIIDEALKVLGLKKIDSNVKFKGEDIFTKEPFTMYERKGNYLINTKESENIISIPDSAIPFYLERIFKKRGVAKDEIKSKVSKTLNEYHELSDNQILKTDHPGISLRKGKLIRKEPVKETNKALTPLIGKIVVISLNYIFSKIDIEKIINYEIIKKHARDLEPLPHEYMLYYSPEQNSKLYSRWHAIIVFIHEMSLEVCVRLFNHHRWFFISSITEPIKLPTPENELISEVGYVISFEEKPELDFVYKVVNSDEEYIINLIS